MIDVLAIYLAGILTGVVILRYGFGLGVKASVQIKNNLTMTGSSVGNTAQEFTTDIEESEKETE